VCEKGQRRRGEWRKAEESQGHSRGQAGGKRQATGDKRGKRQETKGRQQETRGKRQETREKRHEAGNTRLIPVAKAAISEVTSLMPPERKSVWYLQRREVRGER
jgi:hypothetical protein